MKSITTRSVSLFLTAAALVGQDILKADEFEPQPAKAHSDIVCWPAAKPKEASSLADANFAQALAAALRTNNFNSLVITFAQCFGGGMMDDVANAFASSIRPISMTSGSKHDEFSYSRRALPGVPNYGYSFWGEAYKFVHPGIRGGINRNPSESVAYEEAKQDDVWTTANPKRTAQLKTLNGGGSIVLGLPAARTNLLNFHALLFAGDPTGRPDYWNDIARQFRMLTNSGYPPGSIDVLYGKGTAPTNALEPAASPVVNASATRSNLLGSISALANVMTPNTQLYIFITDHGSDDLNGDALAKVIMPNGAANANNTFAFDPFTPAQAAQLSSALNDSGPYLQLNVDAPLGISSNYFVFLNNSPVNGGDNQLEPNGTNFSFSFPVSPGLFSLTGTNVVWLPNSSPGDPPISVELYLCLGEFGVVPGILSPTLAIARQGSATQLSFDTEPDVTYLVQFAESPSASSWFPLATNNGTGQTFTLSDPLGATNRFYRVKVLTPLP